MRLVPVMELGVTRTSKEKITWLPWEGRVGLAEGSGKEVGFDTDQHSSSRMIIWRRMQERNREKQ